MNTHVSVPAPAIGDSVTAQEVIDEMRYTIPLRVGAMVITGEHCRAPQILRRAMEFIRDHREEFDEWSKQQKP